MKFNRVNNRSIELSETMIIHFLHTWVTLEGVGENYDLILKLLHCHSSKFALQQWTFRWNKSMLDVEFIYIWIERFNNSADSAVLKSSVTAVTTKWEPVP